ncbi:DUF6281 family protein [Streptomyces prunicolor]|uniref:DUF6281 family protein n=1 Tax=Streptomyces prunicolor TaxID=67348 RepID=UPI00386304A4|nr:DUF6281 family protein [Streptomyces prunicolor]
MTTALRTGRRLIVTTALLAAAVGCSDGGSSAASCSGLVTFQNRGYLPAVNVDFTVGEKLGAATVPECDDTNHPDAAVPEGKTTAYAVEGMDPSLAIAVGDTPAEATLMRVHEEVR